MTLAAIKVITFLRQHRRIAGKCGRIARHIHNTFTIRCGKANKAYAASAPQHKHRCAADQAAFYPIAPHCNRAWVHFKQIGRLKSTHWLHSYMKRTLSRVRRIKQPAPQSRTLWRLSCPSAGGDLGCLPPNYVSCSKTECRRRPRVRSAVHRARRQTTYREYFLSAPV